MRDESALDDRWLSVEEISQYLGVKRDTIYKWLENRQMPAHKVGRLWKFQKRPSTIATPIKQFRWLWFYKMNWRKNLFLKKLEKLLVATSDSPLVAERP